MLIKKIGNTLANNQAIDQNTKKSQHLFTIGKESLQLFFVTLLEWLDLFAVACN